MLLSSQWFWENKGKKEGLKHLSPHHPASHRCPLPRLEHSLFVHKTPTKWQTLCSPNQIPPFGRFSQIGAEPNGSPVFHMGASLPKATYHGLGLGVFSCSSYQWTGCVFRTVFFIFIFCVPDWHARTLLINESREWTKPFTEMGRMS